MGVTEFSPVAKYFCTKRLKMKSYLQFLTCWAEDLKQMVLVLGLQTSEYEKKSVPITSAP